MGRRCEWRDLPPLAGVMEDVGQQMTDDLFPPPGDEEYEPVIPRGNPIFDAEWYEFWIGFGAGGAVASIIAYFLF